MSYLVLARKYRPRTFADMVGQETTTRTLQGAITENRIGHAYLFSGPRGTGKTSIARIFAKALNCERGPAPEPCNTCERCISADDGSEIDIIEMDAASNRRIEDFRQIRDQVAYAPMRARYKVYIIDEVHMVTKEAFNSFLKTLEEPPAHVKFLFATTDPDKVIETIRSRCQICRLDPISDRTIAARLAHVFTAENVRPASGVTEELARRARGGMRDALSLADQLLSLVGDAPTLADVLALSASGGTESLEALLDRIEAHDKAGTLTSLPAIEGGEGDLVAHLLDHLRSSLVLLLCGESSPLVEVEADLRVRMRTRAARLGVERIQIWLEELIHARERMRQLPSHARVVLEITLLDLCRPETGLALFEIEQRLVALEARLAGVSPPVQAAQAVHAVREPSPMRSTVVTPSVAVAHVVPAKVPAGSEPEKILVPVERVTERAVDRSAPRAPAASNPGTPQHTTPDRPRPLQGGTADTWKSFLDELAKNAASLADTLRLRGKLADLASGRAVIQLANLRDHERAQVQDARNQKACANALSSLMGVAMQVTLEDQSAVKKSRDEYTTKVAELFEGRIEDDA